MRIRPNGTRGLSVVLKYVSTYERKRRDGTTKTVYRLRMPNKKTVYLCGEPGSPEFMAHYHAAIKGEAFDKKKAKRGRLAKPYSLQDLIERYQSNAGYRRLSDGTREVYGRVLKRMAEKYGDMPVKGFKRRHIIEIQSAMSDTPTEANRWVSIFRILMDVALDLEWISQNPAARIKKLRVDSDGFHSWTDAEIQKYLAAYGEGTRERLAFFLLLFTAQRGSDVFDLGFQHLTEGGLNIKQQKTGTAQFIPLPDIVLHEINLHPKSMTFIQKKNGQPYVKKPFQQWFSRTATKIDLPHCSAHGLRKAASRILAEGNVTTKGIQSLTGHISAQEVARYTKAANQKRLAKSTVGVIEERVFGYAPNNVAKVTPKTLNKKD